MLVLPPKVKGFKAHISVCDLKVCSPSPPVFPRYMSVIESGRVEGEQDALRGEFYSTSPRFGLTLRYEANHDLPVRLCLFVISSRNDYDDCQLALHPWRTMTFLSSF